MTPLDKAREALAAVEKATAGEWYQPDGADGHIWNNDAEPGEGYTPDRVIFEGPIQPQWAKDRKPDEWYGENERNLAAAAAAVNFVRAGLPALLAEHERLADRVAKLEAGLKPFAAFTDALEAMGGNTPKTGVWYALESSASGLRELTVEDFHATRALLTPAEGDDDGR